MLANGVHGMSVLTAITAQNSLGVQGAWELPDEQVRAQFRSVVDDIGVDAVKTGMLASPSMVRVVASLLRTLPPSRAGRGRPGRRCPSTATRCWPRMRWTPSAPRSCRWPLSLTPNLNELGPLTGVSWRPWRTGELAAEAAAGRRRVLGAGQGRSRRRYGVGRRAARSGVRRTYSAVRADNRHTHGTGCTLASAIASYLARGYDAVGGRGGEGVRDRCDRGRVRPRCWDRSGRSRVEISREWQLSKQQPAGRRVLRAVRVQLRHR